MNNAHLLDPLTERSLRTFGTTGTIGTVGTIKLHAVPVVPIVPAVPFVFYTFVLIDHRSQPRYSLLIRHSDDAHGFKLKRSTQPLDHLRACRNHSIKARNLP